MALTRFVYEEIVLRIRQFGGPTKSNPPLTILLRELFQDSAALSHMLSGFFLLTNLIVFSLILLLTTESWALTTTPKTQRKAKDSASSNRMSSTKKRKFISDGLDVLQSFAALEGNPLDVHTLILGTLPSAKSYGQDLSSKEILLRGGDGHQNYGHSRNSFWNIVGSAFGFHRHKTPFGEQVRILTDQGYAVWDVLSEAKRKGSLDSNLVKGSLVPTDLPRFILDHPNLNRFVFPANSAEVFCKKDVWAEWLATGKVKTNGTTTTFDEFNMDDYSCEVMIETKFWIQGGALNPETFARTNAIFGKKKAVSIIDDPAVARSYTRITTFDDSEEVDDEKNDTRRRMIELIVIPSTSPANASNRPPEKEKKWHVACYRLREPPQHYVCPGCEYHRETHDSSTTRNSNTEKHWFHDCSYLEAWKAKKKLGKKLPKKQITCKETEDDTIDPFSWYM